MFYEENFLSDNLRLFAHLYMKGTFCCVNFCASSCVFVMRNLRFCESHGLYGEGYDIFALSTVFILKGIFLLVSYLIRRGRGLLALSTVFIMKR